MSIEVTNLSHGSKTVSRALRLLTEVAVAPDGLTLSVAARAVDLPLSTVARLLRTLEGSGFVVRGADGAYKGGPAVMQIGAIAVANLEIFTLAEPYLQQLSDFTGETAYLATPYGSDAALYLKQVESPRAIRHATWTGRSISIEGTALGCALRGELSEAGFALSRGTTIEPEAAAAAAPIIDSTGNIVAAMSVIGPSFRIDDDSLHVFGESVAKHARELSAQLRNLPPQGPAIARGVNGPAS